MCLLPPFSMPVTGDILYNTNQGLQTRMFLPELWPTACTSHLRKAVHCPALAHCLWLSSHLPSLQWKFVSPGWGLTSRCLLFTATVLWWFRESHFLVVPHELQWPGTAGHRGSKQRGACPVHLPRTTPVCPQTPRTAAAIPAKQGNDLECV